MEDYCVYETSYKFEAFYTNKNRYENIQIVGTSLISRFMVFLLVLNVIFPLHLNLESLR